MNCLVLIDITGGEQEGSETELRDGRRKRKKQPRERRSSQHYLTSSI